ncbi:MAG TPA: hypothetical protein VHT93_02355 [Pseudolabrys sp.]|jgi:hypothetical protein|nr:hypothetical protein [Pseudolabrys sp.]
MAGAETTVERLRAFLRELSPQARSLLIGELERAVLRGDDMAGADLVLQELRHIVREEREGGLRVSHAARLFFTPLEPFLVDDRADHNHPGRIARASLDGLWNWIRRDLLATEASAYCDAVGEALLAGDEDKAAKLARAFQDRVGLAIDGAFAAAADEKTLRRLRSQIGTPRDAADAAALKSVLKGRNLLSTLGAHLPLRLGNLTSQQIADCKAMVENVASRDRDLLLYSLLMVMNRLAAPWQLIRFGVSAAGSDTAARVAETPYAVTVTIVLAELERLVGELRDDLRSGQGVAVGVLLKTIHDCARGLRTELDLPVDSTWGRALAAQRAQISDLLRSEIESMPGRVRRLLRPRPSSDIRPHSTLDAGDVAETEALVEFVGTCRTFAGELAISEMTQRTFSELQRYLEDGSRALLDGVRHAGDADRSFRQSQVDAAVRLSAKVFGKDYAALLGKAADVARASERKAARG